MRAGPTGVASVDLLVAALDLKLVQLIRGAMRAADIASGKGQSATPLGPAPDPAPSITGRRHYTPEPVYEARRHFHPTPRYEPRPVIHPTPRVEVAPPIVIPAEPCVEKCHCLKSPFIPSWKLLPWQNPPQPAQVVKVVKVKPDIVRKGSMIDCFM